MSSSPPAAVISAATSPMPAPTMICTGQQGSARDAWRGGSRRSAAPARPGPSGEWSSTAGRPGGAGPRADQALGEQVDDRGPVRRDLVERNRDQAGLKAGTITTRLSAFPGLQRRARRTRTPRSATEAGRDPGHRSERPSRSRSGRAYHRCGQQLRRRTGVPGASVTCNAAGSTTARSATESAPAPGRRTWSISRVRR